MHIDNVGEFEPANGQSLFVAPTGVEANETLAKNSESFANENWEECETAEGKKIRGKEVNLEVFRALANVRHKYSLRFFIRNERETRVEEVRFGEARLRAAEAALDIKVEEVKQRVKRR